MIEDCDVPFQFKRKKLYKKLKGSRVNITYYPDKQKVAGMNFEIMKVVRIRIAKSLLLRPSTSFLHTTMHRFIHLMRNLI